MPTAEQLSRSRDLKVQLRELNNESEQEIVFRETSAPKRRVRLYSRMDGEPLDIPAALAEKALEKTLPDGSFMFTPNPDDAPAYHQGDVKCFLHEESTERMSGVLDQVGLAGITCPAANLASVYSKRIHAQHRHRQQWEAYQEAIAAAENREWKERQEQQLQATLALAGMAAVNKPEVAEPSFACDECDWAPAVDNQKPAHALAMHKRVRHSAGEVADAVTE